MRAGITCSAIISCHGRSSKRCKSGVAKHPGRTGGSRSRKAETQCLCGDAYCQFKTATAARRKAQRPWRHRRGRSYMPGASTSVRVTSASFRDLTRCSQTLRSCPVGPRPEPRSCLFSAFEFHDYFLLGLWPSDSPEFSVYYRLRCGIAALLLSKDEALRHECRRACRLALPS